MVLLMKWHSMKWRLPFAKRKKTQSVKGVTVDRARCRGCFLCVRIVPEVFCMDESGKARIRPGIMEMDNETLRRIVSACPACAIREKESER